MKRLVSLFLLAILAGCMGAPDVTTQPLPDAPLAQELAQQPLYFAPNRGQAGQDVAYTVHGGGHALAFTEREIVLAQDVRLRFVNAAPRQPLGVEQTPARVNYLIGNEPANWQTDLPTYRQLLYTELYSGIDAHFEGAAGALKYTIVVKPGADVSQIRLAFEGAQGLRIDDGGDLIIQTPRGEWRDAAPSACQDSDGQRAPVDVAFALYDNPAGALVGFDVRGKYDPTRPLFIDPTLFYASYLGGSAVDRGRAIALDAEGNVYVTGDTNSSDFPTLNPFQADQAYTDVFVAKLSPAAGGAASLVYATYLGGSNEEQGLGLAIDAAGHAYVTGLTYSTDFPTTPNGYQPEPYGSFPISGNRRVFVSRLSTAGDALEYSTYLRGSGGVEGEWAMDEQGRDIAVCGAGIVCVTGETRSPDYPTTPDAFQKNKAGDDSTWDAFLTKLDTTQSGAASLLYSTYFGGAHTERGLGIAVDEAGGIYVGGQTLSPDLPLQHAYQTTPGGDWDGFVAKFSASGALLYSTYLGSSQVDWVNDVAALAGHAYAAGLTDSSNFPTRNPYQSANQGNRDAFVAKLDTALSGDASLVYATYLGGEDNECSYSGCYVAVDGQGRVFVAGSTYSAYFPTRNSYRDDSLWDDAFVTQFNLAGNDLIYSTYLGGNGSDGVTGIAVDGQGRAHVAGMTSSTKFFDMRNPYQADNAGEVDAFVVVLGADAPDLSTSSKQVDPKVIAPAGAPTYTLSYTITLVNTGYLTATAARLTDTLPGGLALSAAPTCSSGQCAYIGSSHTITWTGSVPPGATVAITYAGQISVPVGSAALFYPNVAWLDDGVNPPVRLTAVSEVNPRYVYLPLVKK